MRYSSRGLKRRRNTDKWDVTLSHRDPLTGKLVSTYHTVKATTKKRAEKARDELIIRLEANGDAYDSKMTLSDFLDSFIQYKEGVMQVERSTADHYRKQARVLNRYMGSYPLCDISIPVVNDWMAQMMSEGYAARSVLKPFGLLKQAMNYAVAIDLVRKNPCDFCKPPKITRRKLNVLDRAERTRMLRLARDAEPSPLALAVELALTTGMRRGEICALRWSDIGECEVTVNRAISLDRGKAYEKDPKTDGSYRTIPLTKRLYAVLRAIEKDKQYVCRELEVPFGDPFILGTPDPDSRPYHPTQLTRDFHAFCKMNGFDLTFHDLRHTFATMMIAGGTDVRTVASYLGHSNVAMTLNTYAEVDPDAKRAAVGKIGEAFDMDLDGVFAEELEEPAFTMAFTVEQLRAMLAEAERREAASACA
ncbi:MAG: site-specific integrase [Eggerthellaceae bacterium]|nr:site-specific integrase [Eggerthellaceae bacterium]